MARWDHLTGALLLLFAVYTMITAVRLGLWMGRIPGPGFAPLWIGAGLALCALVLLARPASGPAHPAPEERAAARREVTVALETAAATAAAIFLIPVVGMLGGLALLLLALVRLLGGSWRSAASTAVIVPVVFYLMFVRWLAVPVPRGPWGF